MVISIFRKRQGVYTQAMRHLTKLPIVLGLLLITLRPFFIPANALDHLDQKPQGFGDPVNSTVILTLQHLPSDESILPEQYCFHRFFQFESRASYINYILA